MHSSVPCNETVALLFPSLGISMFFHIVTGKNKKWNISTRFVIYNCKYLRELNHSPRILKRTPAALSSLQSVTDQASIYPFVMTPVKKSLWKSSDIKRVQLVRILS